MNRITVQLVNNFLKEEEIVETEKSVQFEMFANYSIVGNEYNKTFDCSLLNIGGSDDTGIDGIAIIVNGHLIENTDEIESLRESNGSLEVTFIFIQAKTSSSFELGEMLKFYTGIKDFFAETPSLRRNSDIVKFNELSNYIFNNSVSFKENPICKIFYVTNGTWNNQDQTLCSAKQSIVNDLELTNLFSKVESNTYGSREITNAYRKLKNPITATFIFSNKATLDTIEGIDQSYYGIIPFKEFKKIIVDDNDNIHSVFNDNVRDFQGATTTVNRNINEALLEDNPFLFSVLNNGITIVASKIKTSANTFTIEDYQIVNGCQTSNVLFEHRNNSKLDDLNIPLRLISTNDEDIKSKITVSTNNQTAIKAEQLTAMSIFQKDLESYYSTLNIDNDGGKLYYERRSKQYNGANVIKRRVITIPNQIKSFSAMFHQNPDKVTSFYGTIVKDIGGTSSSIFKDEDKLSAYYLAGLAYYRLDSLFLNGTIPSNYKKIKYFLLMLFLMYASINIKRPKLNSKQMDSYCNEIIQKLNDVDICKELFEKTVSLIISSGIDIDDKRYIKSVGITQNLIKTFEDSLQTIES